MKKWIETMIFGAVFLCMTGCGQREEQDRITIAVSTIGPTHSWAEGVLYYAEEELKRVSDENGWDYICVTGNDANEQSEQVVELAEQQVDCIVMLPMDGASLKTAAIAVQQADIPLVIFDREIPDFVPTATVKGDNPGIGIETARFFNNYFTKGTTVLEVMGDTSTVPFQRTDGFDETLNKKFEKIQVGYTDWQREDTRKLFQEWIQKQPAEVRRSVGAIFTHDDEIAMGVMESLNGAALDQTKKEEFLKNFKALGASSGLAEIYAVLKDKHQTITRPETYDLFSVTYDPAMIQEAVNVMIQHLDGESDIAQDYIIPVHVVDSENVEEYQAFGSYDEKQ